MSTPVALNGTLDGWRWDGERLLAYVAPWYGSEKGFTDDEAEALGFRRSSALNAGEFNPETPVSVEIWVAAPEGEREEPHLHPDRYLVWFELGYRLQAIFCAEFPQFLSLLRYLAPILTADDSRSRLEMQDAHLYRHDDRNRRNPQDCLYCRQDEAVRGCR